MRCLVHFFTTLTVVIFTLSAALPAAFAQSAPVASENYVAPNNAQNRAINDAIQQYLQTQTRGLPGTVTTNIGPLDLRTQLADCTSMEPFTPPGNRLWGKTMLGVRCLGPAHWSIYVPVQVVVTGDYVVTTRPITVGQVLQETDLSTRKGDLTSLPPSVLSAPSQAVGKSLKNSLAAGQPLRSEVLLAQKVIQQGQDVRLIYKGAGFSVTNEGKALNDAADGQVVRARTSSGQTISGIARQGGIIEIRQ